MKDDTLIGNFVVGANAGRSRVVVVKLPGGDQAVWGCSARDIYNAGWPKVGPGELLFAGPNNSYRMLGCARQTGGLDRGFARMLAAISRAGVGHQHANLFFRHAKSFCEFRPHSKGT